MRLSGDLCPHCPSFGIEAPKLLDGFDGKLAATKWAVIAKCSQDTAQRDVQGLIDPGVLVKDAAGSSARAHEIHKEIFMVPVR